MEKIRSLEKEIKLYDEKHISDIIQLRIKYGNDLTTIHKKYAELNKSKEKNKYLFLLSLFSIDKIILKQYILFTIKLLILISLFGNIHTEDFSLIFIIYFIWTIVDMTKYYIFGGIKTYNLIGLDPTKIINYYFLSETEKNKYNKEINSMSNKYKLTVTDTDNKHKEKIENLNIQLKKRFDFVLNNLKPIKDNSLILKKDENLFFIEPVDFKEPRVYREYRTGNKGIPVKMGNRTVSFGKTRGETVFTTENTSLEEGTLKITNKRLIYIGQNKNHNIVLKRINNIDYYNDGVIISLENRQKPITFNFLSNNKIKYKIMIEYIKNLMIENQ